METLKSAQAEMNSIVAENRVLKTLTRNIPLPADKNQKLSEEAPVYSDVKKELIEPFDIVHVNGRLMAVQNKSKNVRGTFNAFQIKLFLGLSTNSSAIAIQRR